MGSGFRVQGSGFWVQGLGFWDARRSSTESFKPYLYPTGSKLWPTFLKRPIICTMYIYIYICSCTYTLLGSRCERGPAFASGKQYRDHTQADKI